MRLDFHQQGFQERFYTKLKKYSFLDYLIKRLKLLKSISEIIIAMPDDEQNKDIVLIAKKIE